MLVVVNVSRDLIYVFKSITEHSKQLILTSFLGVLIIFIFSNFSFWFFNSYFNGIDTVDGGVDEGLCSSLFSCFFLVLDFGFRNGGGIGDTTVAEPVSHGDLGKYAAKVALDISFFFIVNIIFLNLVFGIIIDTFGELREISDKKTNDQDNLCFICNLDVQKISRTGEDFVKHREEVHNVWSYVYYFFGLKSMDQKDMNGEELLINSKYDEGDLSLFPMEVTRQIRITNYHLLLSCEI
jgi:hypothetical protein